MRSATVMTGFFRLKRAQLHKALALRSVYAFSRPSIKRFSRCHHPDQAFNSLATSYITHPLKARTTTNKSTSVTRPFVGERRRDFLRDSGSVSNHDSVGAQVEGANALGRSARGSSSQVKT